MLGEELTQQIMLICDEGLTVSASASLRRVGDLGLPRTALTRSEERALKLEVTKSLVEWF